MRVIIAGSRSIKGEQAEGLIAQAAEDANWPISEVISGDAEGVDKAAIEWAKKKALDWVIMPANWTGKGKRAGYARNKKMAWYARSASRILELQDKEVELKWKGGLIAIWDGKSKGTAHMIDLAREFGLEVFILTHPHEKSDSFES